jgi:hypothetical protein
MEFFQSSVGQGIEAIIVFGSLLLAGFCFLKQRRRKEISYRILANTPVLTVRREVEDRVRMTLGGHQIADARLVMIRLWNSGNIPIVTNDYILPITFNFGRDVEILDAEILETNPNNIQVPLKLDTLVKQEHISDEKGKGVSVDGVRFRNLTIEPPLLNSSDCFTLKVLLTNAPYKEKIQLDGRIVGVKELHDAWKDEIDQLMIGLRLVLIGMIIILSAIFIIAIPFHSIINPNIFLVIMLFGCLLLVIGLPMLYIATWKSKKFMDKESKSWGYIE